MNRCKRLLYAPLMAGLLISSACAEWHRNDDRGYDTGDNRYGGYNQDRDGDRGSGDRNDGRNRSDTRSRDYNQDPDGDRGTRDRDDNRNSSDNRRSGYNQNRDREQVGREGDRDGDRDDNRYNRDSRQNRSD